MNDDGLTDPAPLRDKISAQIGELFDLNQRVVGVLRIQARDFEQIGAFYQVMSQRAFAIASDIMELSALSSTNTTNIIIAEFGHDESIQLVTLEEEDDDERD